MAVDPAMGGLYAWTLWAPLDLHWCY